MDLIGEGALSDVAICQRVGEVLQRHYQDHPWLVGLHEVSTGVLVIDLPHAYKPPSLRQMAYLMHLTDIGDDAKIMRAGGEWLERLGLARARAHEFAQQMARENGLDVRNSVTKSR